MPILSGQKLSFKIIAPLIVALIVCMSIAAYTLISQRSKNLEKILFTKAQNLAVVGATVMESELTQLLETGLITRENLFDTSYQRITEGPLAKALPPRYHTQYDQLLDHTILKTLDAFIAQDPSLLFAILVDRNGYTPTHNTRYSLIPTSFDDQTLNRTKRIFDDPIGLAAAQFKGDGLNLVLIQRYERDTGEKVWDVSTPVYLDGEHWGAFRLGLSMDTVTSSINDLRVTVVWITLLTILTISLLTYWGVKRALQPLSLITRNVQLIASGVEEKQLTIESRDEIGALARAFNEMSQRLNQTTISRDYYDLILESMSEALLIVSCGGVIESVNPAACGLFGYHVDQLVGQHVSLLFGLDEKQKESELKATKVFWDCDCVKQGVVTCLCSLYGQDGDEIWVALTRSPLVKAESKLNAMIWIAQDVTQSRRADISLKDALNSAQEMAVSLEVQNEKLVTQQGELEEAYKELKLSQKMMVQQEKLASIGQLAAGIAHEVNNPIGFIASNLKTLRRYQEKLLVFIQSRDTFLSTLPDCSGKDEIMALRKGLKLDILIEDSNDLINESLEGTERIHKIVQGLKTFSRTDHSDYEVADINECLDGAINIIWNELKYKATLHRDYGQLPQTYCYPYKLGQVFMNLMINAAHAIETTGDIHLKTRFEDGKIHIWVIDTGCGIPEEIRKKIFEPFFTTKDVGKGTGLGMSITHEIIQQHHGIIHLTSEVGIGTKFQITIPLVESTEGHHNLIDA